MPPRLTAATIGRTTIAATTPPKWTPALPMSSACATQEAAVTANRTTRFRVSPPRQTSSANSPRLNPATPAGCGLTGRAALCRTKTIATSMTATSAPSATAAR